MKETWSAMRKVIAPIMLVALATTGMTVAGSTAAHADTTSTITFDGSTYDSIASGYGCDWWTSANNAKTDATYSAGNALQCSHDNHPAGVRLTASSGMTFTNSAAPTVSFNVYRGSDAAADDLNVRIVADGVAAPNAHLTGIPVGWSTQTIDFSTVDGYVSSAAYKRLDIEQSGSGSEWVDNINLQIDAPAPVAETSGLQTITFDGAQYDSLAGTYGCDWWTSANTAKADATYSAGNAMQCSHDAHESGIRVTTAGGKTITNSSSPSVTFNVNRQADAAGSLLVRINAPGVAASEVTLSNVPAGWSTQTVDFSAAAGYSASAPYTVLDIAESSAGHIWVDNINFYLNVPGSASASPSASASAAADSAININFDGAADDSMASAFGCNWWTSINNAKTDANHSGNQLQCSHEYGGGVRIEKAGRTITNGTFSKVAFDIFASGSLNIQVSLLGSSSAPKVNLSVPDGWSHQVVDFSSATFADASTWSASDTYTRLDISQGDGSNMWVDNIKANQAITSPTPSATPSDSTPVVASIKLDSADLGPAGVYSVGNGWWNEGSGSRSVVKYLAAGGTYTLHYTVLDTTGTAVSGAQVTLATSGDAEGATTGSRTGTTDASGKVTFTFTNATANSAAEYPRSDTSTWTDPEVGSAVIWNAIPYISGTSKHTQCYDAGNATSCNRDRLWGHVVSTATYSKPALAWVRLLASDKSAMTDKSGWWTDNPANHSMVKLVTVGNKMVLRYQVTKGGTPVANRLVTLTKESIANGANFTGTLTATTDSNGIATFTFTAVAPNGAENRPVAPSSMNYWDDSRNQGANTEVHLTPAVAGSDISGIKYDRVWAHIVAAPSSQAVPAAPYQVSAVRSGAKQITVSWNAATEDGAANTGYEVTLTPKSGSPVVATAAASATSLAINLTSAASYTASVKAINSAGKSAATSASSAIAPGAAAPKVLGAPTFGTSPIKGIDALWLPFSPSGTDTGSTATGYQYSIDGGTTWNVATYDTASVLADGVTPDATRRGSNILFLYGLTAGNSYSVLLRAVNSVGVSAASAAKVTSTATAPTGKPALTTVDYSGTTLTIGFTGISTSGNGGSAITGYRYSLNNGVNWIPVTLKQWQANAIVVTGLAATYAPFVVTMQGTNGAWSASAVAKTVTTVSATPTFTVTAGTGKVTLSITALTATQNTSNSAVTKYQYTTNNGVTWVNAQELVTVIAAAKGTTISVKVRAVNSVGVGTASAAKSATTK
jgi:hypothetical protein